MDAEKQVMASFVPKDESDARNAILEVRPGKRGVSHTLLVSGTGGEEASLFCLDIFRMYQRYAESKGWKFEVLSLKTETDFGGCKDASASISGDNVFGMLKWERGVHRVQRVPDTETMGRVHTSTMTVAILPEAEEVT